MSQENLSKKLGQQVTLTGKTVRYRAGAAFVFDGVAVFIAGLDDWPDEVSPGSEITVSGKLAQYHVFPVSEVAKDGMVTQGVAPGTKPPFVIENAKWKVIKPGAK